MAQVVPMSTDPRGKKTVPDREVEATINRVSKIMGIKREEMFGPNKRRRTKEIKARAVVVHMLLSGRPDRSRRGLAPKLGMDHTSLMYILKRPPPPEIDSIR